MAAELADRLARMGHRVYLFATSRPFRLPEASPAVHVPVDLPYYPVFPGPLYTLSLAGTLEREAKRLGLDLVHTHYAVPHAAAAYLAFGEGLPLVHTLHGTDVSVVGMDPAFHGPTRRALEAARAVTAVSRALAQEAKRAFGVEAVVVPNAVDPERFRPRPERKRLYAEEGEWLLVHASNFRPIKRVPDIVRAFAKIRKRLPARLLLLGTGPEEEEARRVAAELGVAPGSPSTPTPTRRRSWGRRTSSFWPRRRSPSARRPSRPWPPASPWWPRRWAGWPRWSPPRWAGSWSSATWRPWRRPPWTSWEAPASPR